MTEVIAKKVVLKDVDGTYLIPFVDNIADVELSNLTNTGKSQYNPFCINTGETNADGSPACMVLDGDTLMTQGTFICSAADGTIYEISDVLTLDISSYDDGNYNIFINPDVPELYLMQNTIYTGTSMPSEAVKYDYLINTSKVPYRLDEKTDDGVEPCIASHAVWAGVLTLSGGGLVTLNSYNRNLEVEEARYLTETYVNGQSWYRVYSDGWLEQGGYIDIAGGTTSSFSLLISYKDTNYTVLMISYGGGRTNDNWDYGGIGGHPNSESEVYIRTGRLNSNGAYWVTYGMGDV